MEANPSSNHSELWAI